ncbi:MAG: TetR/AcrR family transcriptional regulator [Clostridia bacterium]|nr:TetR/AcrR family transcriptional regulator [Clostridia bacterium]
MAELQKSKLIKHEIIKTATALFLEVGYSKTSPQMIAKELGISTGNLTYHYPTKEHLLAVLVKMLCEFQEKLIVYEADKGLGPAMSICIELMTVAAACEENEVARDFFVSTFQSPMCLEYLRKSHVERAKRIFAEQCKDWSYEQFIEAEILVQGIDYATIISNDVSLSLDVRISGALNQILSIYNLPEDIRKQKIERVLALDCRGLGKRVLDGFKEFVEQQVNAE